MQSIEVGRYGDAKSTITSVRMSDNDSTPSWKTPGTKGVAHITFRMPHLNGPIVAPVIDISVTEFAVATNVSKQTMITMQEPAARLLYEMLAQRFA